MNAVVALLGGVRATVFAGLALVLLAAAGVQSLRLDRRTAERDMALANNALWEQADESNTKAIADLRDANKAWADAARATERKAAQAVDTVARERDALAAELDKRRRDRGVVYREHPDAAAWGRMPVPDAIARQLRE